LDKTTRFVKVNLLFSAVAALTTVSVCYLQLVAVQAQATKLQTQSTSKGRILEDDLSTVISKFGFKRQSGQVKLFKDDSRTLALKTYGHEVTLDCVKEALEQARVSRFKRFRVINSVIGKLGQKPKPQERFPLIALEKVLNQYNYRKTLRTIHTFSNSNQDLHVVIESNGTVTYSSLLEALNTSGTNSNTRSKILNLVTVIYRNIDPHYNYPKLVEDATYLDLLKTLTKGYGFSYERPIDPTSNYRGQFHKQSSGLTLLIKEDISQSNHLSSRELEDIFKTATLNGKSRPVKGVLARSLTREINRVVLARSGIYVTIGST